MTEIISKIRKRLAEVSDEKIKKQTEHFFREEVRSYGLKSANLRKLSKEFLAEVPDRSKENIFRLCEDLFSSGYLEECGIACLWSESVRKQFVAEDIVIFEKWIGKYVSNWAVCDTFCNHTVGELVMKYPDEILNLRRWARSTNRWMRRASAVSLIIPARKGMFLSEIFEIAGALLTDTDDMVQKGYGWMLKAASEAHRQEIYDFVMSKRSVMPRTAFRYAIEKMPPAMRAKAMEK